MRIKRENRDSLNVNSNEAHKALRPLRQRLKQTVAGGFIALALLTAPAFMLSPVQSQAQATQSSIIMLKPSSIVEGDYVRLGDLFEGLPDHKARMVISRAPAIGRPAIVDAGTLQRIAQNYGLTWQASSRFDQITVERAASLVTIEEIEATLTRELQQQIAGQFRLELGSRHYHVTLPASERVEIKVEDLNVNRTRGTFSANLKITNEKGDQRSLNIAGRAIETIQVPVLSERIQRNAVISQADLDWIDVDAASLPTNVIIDPELLVGMTPRRMVTPHVPLRMTDLAAPTMVNRGDMVTVMLKKGTLTLSMKGRAIEAGAQGETIRIMNPTSNRTIQARVIDYQLVEMETGAPNSAAQMTRANTAVN